MATIFPEARAVADTANPLRLKNTGGVISAPLSRTGRFLKSAVTLSSKQLLLLLGGALFVIAAVVIGTAVGLGGNQHATALPAPPPVNSTSTSASSVLTVSTILANSTILPFRQPSKHLQGLHLTLFSRPADQETSRFADPSGGDDLGPNVWFLSDDEWQRRWVERKNTTISLLRYSLGLDPHDWKPRNASSLPSPFLNSRRHNSSSSLAGVILYVPAFIADSSVHGNSPLIRVNELVQDLWSAGLEVVLLFGRPEFHGQGASWGSDTADVVRNAAAGERLKGYIRSFLALPAVQTAVQFVSLYWMGASGYCSGTGPLSCSTDDIASFEENIARTVKSFPRTAAPLLLNETTLVNVTTTVTNATNTTIATLLPSLRVITNDSLASFSYLHHVDGTLWEQHWNAAPAFQASGNWSLGGYGPLSLKRNMTQGDGILAECWTQGSLVNAVTSFASIGEWDLPSSSANGTRFLFVYSVANWAANPSGDASTFFGWLESSLGVRKTWSSWCWLDCGIAELAAGGLPQGCPFSSVLPNATAVIASSAAFSSALTPKGMIFRDRAVAEGVV